MFEMTQKSLNRGIQTLQDIFLFLFFLSLCSFLGYHFTKKKSLKHFGYAMLSSSLLIFSWRASITIEKFAMLYFSISIIMFVLMYYNIVMTLLNASKEGKKRDSTDTKQDNTDKT